MHLSLEMRMLSLNYRTRSATMLIRTTAAAFMQTKTSSKEHKNVPYEAQITFLTFSSSPRAFKLLEFNMEHVCECECVPMPS